MNIYVIFLKTEAEFQLLRRVVSDYPSLKKGFTLKEILNLPLLSWDDRRILKKLFGRNRSEILTPEMNFEYRNGKWRMEEIDVQKGFHQFTTKVFNNTLKDGKYPVNSPVSMTDMELLEFLMKRENDVYNKELKEFEEGGRLPITQELLKFVSESLKEKLGELSYFDYAFIRAFKESLNSYEEILIERELG